MINTNLPSNLANLVAPFSPVGQSPVGEEDSSGRISTFKPVEQAAESGRSGARPQQPGQTPLANSFGDNKEPSEDDPNASEVEKQLAAAEERRMDQEQQEISRLAARDREVRAHEQAHAAIGGQYAGAPQYQFERGPDGVRYAVGGEVPIDVGREATPEATIAKMQIVKRAALAPAEPSPQDRRVAAEASRQEAQARQDLRTQETDSQPEETESEDPDQNTVADNRDIQNIPEVPSGTSREREPITPSLPLSDNSLNSRLNASIANASLASREPGRILDQLV